MEGHGTAQVLEARKGYLLEGLGLVGGYSIITTVCIGRISHEPGQARSPDIVRQEVEVRAQEARRESPGLGGQAGKSWPRKPGGKVLAEEAGGKVPAQEARRESPGPGGQAGKSWPRKPGGKVRAEEAGCWLAKLNENT